MYIHIIQIYLLMYRLYQADPTVYLPPRDHDEYNDDDRNDKNTNHDDNDDNDDDRSSNSNDISSRRVLGGGLGGWNVLIVYCWAVLLYLYLLLFVI
jgi:hypothetical protein